MTNAIPAFGATLKKGTTAIAEVLDISGPNLSRATIDATSHGSTGGWKEYLAGVKDGGEVSFTVQYVPTNSTHDASTGLLSLLDDTTPSTFSLVFPDSGSTTWTFNGWVTAFHPSAPVEGKLTAAVTIKVTGQPTLA